MRLDGGAFGGYAPPRVLPASTQSSAGRWCRDGGAGRRHLTKPERGQKISQLCRLTFEEAGDTVVARLVGEIDISNAAEMGEGLPSRMGKGARALIVDMSGVRYLDSSGLGVLFELQRRLDSRRQALRIVVPPKASIRRTLELVGMDVSANVDSSLEAALARSRSKPAT